MNHYELLCILSGKMTETEIGECEKNIETALKNVVSTLHYIHRLDRKKLAFPIDNHAYGYYVFAMFDAEPQTISRIDRELTLMNDILRHALTQKKSVSAPPIAEQKQSSFDALPSITDMPLGNLPLETIVAAEQQPAPVVEETVAEPIAAVEHSVQPLEKAPVEIKEESADEQQPAHDAAESVQQPKKKQEKLSYEELDKRLDEIINNDIF